MSEAVTLEAIQNAEQRISGHVRRTGLYRSPLLSQLTGAELYLKCEQQQVTGSFKERGAANKLLCLSREEAELGVIAASAGNHALGLAYHGQKLGVAATVVMPKRAPIVKVEQCRAYGAVVELWGDSFDEARTHALERAQRERKCYVHGFDDPAIIAGQGTVALEVLEQLPDVEVVLVPVGGGGLIAGMAVALSALKPDVKLIGVESELAPTLSHALQVGAPEPVEVRSSLADGLAVRSAGSLAFSLCRERVAEVKLVSEPEIAGAIVRLMEVERVMVEGAGATAMAYALRGDPALVGKRVVVVLSGGNIDLNLVARIIERGLASAGRLCRLALDLEDHPGSLGRLVSVVSDAGANVLQVAHDRSFAPADVAKVRVTLVLETSSHEHAQKVREALMSRGFEVASDYAG